jgi:hypothetical protein
LLHFFDDQDLRLCESQGIQRGTLQGIDPPIRAVRPTQLMEDAREEASVIGTGRHLQDNHRAVFGAGAAMECRRMQALEFRDNHGLTHTALSIEEKAWHAGARRVLDEFLQAIERPGGPGIAYPIGGPDLSNPIASAIEGAFSDAYRQMGQIQGHR